MSVPRRLVFVLSLVLPAAALQAQDAPPPPPRPWTSSLGAGLAVTSGNRDTRSTNVSFSTFYDPKNGKTFKADALLLRGESEGETNVDKTTAGARYERTLDHSFWFAETSYLRDPFKGIESLISPVAGFGHRLIDSATAKLSLDGGVGAAIESTADRGSASSVAVKAGESLEWTLTPTSRITHRLNGLWKANDLSDAHYHFGAGLVTTIATRAELKISYVYDFKNEPPPDLEQGDSALFAALVLKF